MRETESGSGVMFEVERRDADSVRVSIVSQTEGSLIDVEMTEEGVRNLVNALNSGAEVCYADEHSYWS